MAARGARFRAGDPQLTAFVLIDPQRREELATTAVTMSRETSDPDGRLRMEVTFQDLRHTRNGRSGNSVLVPKR